MLQVALAAAAVPVSARLSRAAEPRKVTTVQGIETAADVAKAEAEASSCSTRMTRSRWRGDRRGVREGLPEDQGVLSSGPERGAFRQAPGRARCGSVRRRRHPVLRAKHGPRFQEARRLRALRLAAARPIRPRPSLRSKATTSVPASPSSASAITPTRCPRPRRRRTWKDLLNPQWRNAVSGKQSTSGLQFVQWYELHNALRRRLLEGLRQAAPARLRLPRATFRPAGERRRSGAPFSPNPPAICSRKTAARRSPSWPRPTACRPAAGDWHGGESAASGSRPAVPRLADVVARTGGLPEQQVPLLPLGPEGCGPDAGRHETVATSSSSFPEGRDGAYQKAHDAFVKEWNGMLGL